MGQSQQARRGALASGGDAAAPRIRWASLSRVYDAQGWALTAPPRCPKLAEVRRETQAGGCGTEVRVSPECTQRAPLQHGAARASQVQTCSPQAAAHGPKVSTLQSRR